MTRNPPHKWLLKMTPKAKSSFNGLDSTTKQVAFRRLTALLQAENPYAQPFVEALKGQYHGIWKFRVGNYRILFVLKPIEIEHLKHIYKGTLYLVDIEDRKDVYRS